MAFTTTTLSVACAATDTAITVASATGFAANQYVRIDQEFMKVASSYTSGTLIPLSGRGQNGTTVAAHAVTANVVTDAISSTVASDWANPNASVVASYPLAGVRRKVTSYGVAGAITLPLGGEDVIAVINGGSALAMTLANPTKDMDGQFLWIASNGKAAHTVTYTAGLGNASTGYTVATFTTGAQQTLALMALNGIWQQAQSQFSGTLTAILIALA